MNAQFQAKLAIYGQWTYRAAWALELTAASIGLTTGLALGYQAFSKSESATASDLALASAPFFMVALAELTKIPIATLLFAAKWIWRPVLAIFLIGLAAITFETVFMGLERAVTLRQLQIETLTEQKNVLVAESKNIEAAVQRISEGGAVTTAQDEVDRTLNLAAKEQEAIQKQIDAIDQQIESQGSLSTEAKLARDRLQEAEAARAELIKERDAEIAVAVAQFEGQRDSFVRRIKDATDPQLKKGWEAELANLVNPRTGITAKYDARVKPAEDKIEALRASFEQERSKVAAPSEEQKALDARRAGLVTQVEESNKKWGKTLDAANQRLVEAQKQAANNDSVVANDRVRQAEIAGKVSDLDKQLIPMARLDQVRRIAGRFFGKNPEDVSVDEASRVALVWFGSLGLLAALAGPITAIVALGLQRAAYADKPVDGKLKRLVRRMLLRWRWRRVRRMQVPVEVRIEVPVEKIVEKPVEKVIKEILYVPILTDNPDEVRRALSKRVPKEVADLVKVSTTGVPRGGKAQHEPA